MKWTEIFAANFQQFKDGESAIWYKELEATVPGWKSCAREQNEDELCRVLRFIAELGARPRSDPNRSNIRYNVSDIKLWIKIHRGSGSSNEQSNTVQVRFVEAIKSLINLLLKGEDRIIAAIVASGNPFAAEVKYTNRLFRNLGNRGPTEAEQELIDAHCREIGFNPNDVFCE